MKMDKLLGKQTTLQASVALAVMSVTSKLLGLARSVLVARNLGASTEYDLYLTVAMFPIAVMTALIYTVSKAVTPYYLAAREAYGPQRASVYGWRITVAGSASLGLAAGVCALFATPIVRWLLPQAGPAELETARRMFRITTFFPVLYFWFSSIGSFLRAERFFIASSLGIVLQNLCIVLALVILREHGTWALVWGYVAALLLQGIVITGFHWLTGHPPDISVRSNQPFPRTYLTGLLLAALQIAFIESWGQLWTVFDRGVAQHMALQDGSISSLTLANALYIIPLSIFNLGIGRVVFPLMARYVAAQEIVKAQKITRQGLGMVAVTLIPIAAFMALDSIDIVGALYLRGAFDQQALETTTKAMQVLILALPLAGCYVIQSSLLYAQRRYRILAAAAVLGGIVKLVTSYVLAGFAGVQGLAASTCLALTTCVLVLRPGIPALSLSRHGVLYLTRILAATLVAVLATWLAIGFLLPTVGLGDPMSWLQHALRAAASAIVFGVTLISSGLALGIEEYRQAIRFGIERLER